MRIKNLQQADILQQFLGLYVQIDFLSFILLKDYYLKALVTVAGVFEYTIYALRPWMTVVTSGTKVKL